MYTNTPIMNSPIEIEAAKLKISGTNGLPVVESSQDFGLTMISAAGKKWLQAEHLFYTFFDLALASYFISMVCDQAYEYGFVSCIYTPPLVNTIVLFQYNLGVLAIGIVSHNDSWLTFFALWYHFSHFAPNLLQIAVIASTAAGANTMVTCRGG